MAIKTNARTNEINKIKRDYQPYCHIFVYKINKMKIFSTVNYRESPKNLRTDKQ